MNACSTTELLEMVVKPATISTFTGRTVSLTDPRPIDIELEDIAHALSNVCRFGGHSSRFYSVAEHSILVSHVVPRRLAIIGLMHDAHEAYLGDVVTSLKDLLPGYRDIAKKMDAAIGRRFSIVLDPLPPEVKQADLMALYHEIQCLFGKPLNDLIPTNLRKDAQALFMRKEVLCLPPEIAKAAFIKRCLELVS